MTGAGPCEWRQMKKIQIRALILDYGGVISRPQDPDIIDTMVCTLAVEHDVFVAAYREERAAYDSSQKTGAEYWQSVLKRLHIEPGRVDVSALIQQDVESWTRIDHLMISFLKGIRKRIFNLSIISNMTEDTLSYLRAGFNWLELFDECVFSCELGINKPDISIYMECLNKIKLSPVECLFVDDSAENIEGAAGVGMHTIRYTAFDPFISDFNENFMVVNREIGSDENV